MLKQWLQTSFETGNAEIKAGVENEREKKEKKKMGARPLTEDEIPVHGMADKLFRLRNHRPELVVFTVEEENSKKVVVLLLKNYKNIPKEMSETINVNIEWHSVWKGLRRQQFRLETTQSPGPLGGDRTFVVTYESYKRHVLEGYKNRSPGKPGGREKRRSAKGEAGTGSPHKTRPNNKKRVGAYRELFASQDEEKEGDASDLLVAYARQSTAQLKATNSARNTARLKEKKKKKKRAREANLEEEEEGKDDNYRESEKVDEPRRSNRLRYASRTLKKKERERDEWQQILREEERKQRLDQLRNYATKLFRGEYVDLYVDVREGPRLTDHRRARKRVRVREGAPLGRGGTGRVREEEQAVPMELEDSSEDSQGDQANEEVDGLSGTSEEVYINHVWRDETVKEDPHKTYLYPESVPNGAFFLDDGPCQEVLDMDTNRQLFAGFDNAPAWYASANYFGGGEIVVGGQN